MTAVSTINPIRAGIDTALSLAGMTVRFGHAPRGTALPYVVMDAETEDQEGQRIGQAGHTPTAQLRCWASDAWNAQELFGAVKAVLHGVAFEVVGHRVLKSRLSRLSGFKEQGVPADATGPYCVVGVLRLETLAT